ncbi:hypothetical protein M413DRAFT_388504 [Hebeloma cylindrosporum]|uniref:Uncharacterized protein n=1 Tax=Hebeloma cylindrosporum TaxID=76867 RepID=A0A0C3CI07_HEBCY|nr:hypothetical protein M413DRAFT_388504 [Hebeloma cylindrosporum h7]
MSTQQSLELSAFPEELLERILSYCIVAPLVLPPRPAWHRPTGCFSATALPIRGRLALLLVSKQFFRISTPLFYHTIHVISASQLHGLLRNAIRPNPFLAGYIRRIVLQGVWADAGELLSLAQNNLNVLDITLDVTQLSQRVHGPIRDFDAEEFCEGLKDLVSLKHIVIRKPNNVYLTQPKPRYVLSGIAKAMQGWDNLEHADIPFRLSDDSSTGANPALSSSTPPVLRVHQAPITALTLALSTRPRLHTFSTLLPSVWNEAILRVSNNPALERIILGDGTGTGGGGGQSHYHHGKGATMWSGKDFYAAPVGASMPAAPVFEGSIAGTGLFLMQARKHTRLSELIRAGTSIMRTRAQTMGTLAAAPNFPSASSSGSAAAAAPPSLSPSGTRAQSPPNRVPAPAPHYQPPRSQSLVPTGSVEPSRCSASSSSSSSTSPLGRSHPVSLPYPPHTQPHTQPHPHPHPHPHQASSSRRCTTSAPLQQNRTYATSTSTSTPRTDLCEFESDDGCVPTSSRLGLEGRGSSRPRTLVDGAKVFS